MLESDQGLPWREIHAIAMSHNVFVEYFPIHEGTIEGLGISLPSKGAGEPGWRELRSVLGALCLTPQTRLIDMYSGDLVPEQHIDRLRNRVLGERD